MATAPIEFPCPSCGHSIKARPAMIGKTGPCPACRESVTVPDPNLPEPGPEDIRREVAEQEEHERLMTGAPPVDPIRRNSQSHRNIPSYGYCAVVGGVILISGALAVIGSIVAPLSGYASPELSAINAIGGFGLVGIGIGLMTLGDIARNSWRR